MNKMTENELILLSLKYLKCNIEIYEAMAILGMNEDADVSDEHFIDAEKHVQKIIDEFEKEKLDETALTLAVRGVKTFGTYDPDMIMPYIEEDLTIDQYYQIERFFSWLHENGLHFGSGNIGEVWAKYLAERSK